MFKSTDSVAKRVNTVIQSTIEIRGENWLVSLGYAECNDFAEAVRRQVSYTGTHLNECRFETVARYVRQHKARIRAKQLAAQPK